MFLLVTLPAPEQGRTDHTLPQRCLWGFYEPTYSLLTTLSMLNNVSWFLRLQKEYPPTNKQLLSEALCF